MREGAVTLTLQDIATLAKVRRPVVSMWRKRARVAGEIVPFPGATAVIDGVEHFDRDEVADYLRRTSRGNNPEFALDAPAATVPDSVDLDDLVTLLCLRTALGDDLSVAGEKGQMAAAYVADPDDSFLVSEVLALRPEPGAVGYVDELVGASFGPGEALNRLDQTRTARRLADRGLSDDARALMTSVARACATHVGDGVVPLTYLGGDPVLAAQVVPDFGGLSVSEVDPDARALRRRAFIRGVAPVAEVGPTVKLASLVGRPDTEALAVLDELVLGLAAGEVAVVIGAASLLTDPLAGGAERRRSHVLRSESLACALRLPRGYWRGAHRQALAIWVCVGPVQVSRPMVVDLEAFDVSEFNVDDVGADVTACLDAALVGRVGDPVQAMGARAFRYLRPHQIADIHGSRTVVPRGVRAERLGTATSSHRDRVIEQVLVTSAPVTALDVAVADAPPSIVVRPTSLGEQADRNDVALRRGSRIDQAAHDPAGTVEVWSADGPTEVRLDPFDAQQRYPRAQRTEPGDVVFEAKPRPRAVVEPRGGALVASPARVLRLGDGAVLRPHTLAAAINLLRDGVGDWKAWPMPSLRPEQADALEAALRRAAAYEAEMRRRLDAAAGVQRELIAGVAAGAITVESHEQPTEETD